MAVSTEQYNRLLARLTKLEETTNDILVALQGAIGRSEIIQLQTILQTDIEDIQETLTALEERVTAIEEEPIS